jgi:hypothetical protein
LQCVGSWTNAATGADGAFAVRLEGGGFGGTLHFEIGGDPFGVSDGIIFDAPFQLIGNQLVIGAQSDSLGYMSARIALDGTAVASLQAIPNLGPKSSATMSDYSFANNELHFVLNIDVGDGRRSANAVITAACSRA